MNAPIGIFDSGYGGLTIFQKIRESLPAYDFLYLGDNARAPYGTRSFEVVYEFTKTAVFSLFARGCPLVILACNTASAKALRTLQQEDLPKSDDPTRRVLGVIRPTVEAADSLSRTKHIGVLGTEGTVASRSYELELAKLFPQIRVVSEACPMWVPLVENRETGTPAAEFFVKRHLNALFSRDEKIDTLILGCTHYPILLPQIRKFLPPGVNAFPQGECVARSLKNYLSRHPEMEGRISRGGNANFLTTESAERFSLAAKTFLGEHEAIFAEHIELK
ncbi:MAG: glutamate racemase [Opitutales bacterium]|nr:glutamate racemase [Opitutales bacterium]